MLIPLCRCGSPITRSPSDQWTSVDTTYRCSGCNKLYLLPKDRDLLVYQENRIKPKPAKQVETCSKREPGECPTDPVDYQKELLATQRLLKESADEVLVLKEEVEWLMSSILKADEIVAEIKALPWLRIPSVDSYTLSRVDTRK